jgi:YD repeat-containing protein
LASTENDTAQVLAATHGLQQVYGYDAAGNQIQTTDFGGNTTSDTLDGDNRLIQSAVVTGTSTLTTTDNYDPDANVLTSTQQLAQPGVSFRTVKKPSFRAI